MKLQSLNVKYSPITNKIELRNFVMNYTGYSLDVS